MHTPISVTMMILFLIEAGYFRFPQLLLVYFSIVLGLSNNDYVCWFPCWNLPVSLCWYRYNTLLSSFNSEYRSDRMFPHCHVLRPHKTYSWNALRLLLSIILELWYAAVSKTFASHAHEVYLIQNWKRHLLRQNYVLLTPKVGVSLPWMVQK